MSPTTLVAMAQFASTAVVHHTCCTHGTGRRSPATRSDGLPAGGPIPKGQKNSQPASNPRTSKSRGSCWSSASSSRTVIPLSVARQALYVVLRWEPLARPVRAGTAQSTHGRVRGLGLERRGMGPGDRPG
jgi:hypothetical protein